VKLELKTEPHKVAAVYNSMADTYDDVDAEPFYHNQYQAYRRALARHLSAFAGEVLDLGCGTGIFTEMLAPRCKRMVGIDIAASLVDKARAKCANLDNVNFVETSATSLPFGDSEFDAVVSFGETISHIQDFGKAFAEVGRVLRPGGIFLFSVLNKWCLQLLYSPSELFSAVARTGGYWRVWRCENDAGEATALCLRAFTSTEIHALAEANSLAVVGRSGIHILSLAIPLRLQNIKSSIFAHAFRLLGKVDESVADSVGARSMGYTCIYAARRR
jgi:ubiquinone/menaquinone biosynthesis C-methylase UbiE